MDSNSFRIEVGNFECLVVTDGTIIVPGPPPPGSSGMPDMEHGKKMDVLCLFINNGKQKILIDTGCGDGFQPTVGRLVGNLKAEGISPAEIDTIIYSHGHSDHVAGSFDAEGRPVFPNARYLVSEKEWNCWVDRPERKELHPMFAAARKNLLPIPDQVGLIEDYAEVIPGIKMIPAPGHTPGNAVLEISSGSRQMLCIGDTLHDPLEFTRPDYYSFLDVDIEQAIQTRTQLPTRIASSGTLVFACHFPFPGIGHFISGNGQLNWQPQD